MGCGHGIGQKSARPEDLAADLNALCGNVARSKRHTKAQLEEWLGDALRISDKMGRHFHETRRICQDIQQTRFALQQENEELAACNAEEQENCAQLTEAVKAREDGFEQFAQWLQAAKQGAMPPAFAFGVPEIDAFAQRAAERVIAMVSHLRRDADIARLTEARRALEAVARANSDSRKIEE